MTEKLANGWPAFFMSEIFIFADNIFISDVFHGHNLLDCGGF